MTTTTTTDDDVVELDSIDAVLDRLKIREVAEIEEVLGAGIDVAFLTGAPRGRALQAIAWVLRKRDNPDFTFEAAGELVIRFSDVEVADRPTNAAGS